MIAVVASSDAERVTAVFKQAGETVTTIGAITASGGVTYNGSLGLA
jgi:phosphoribosylaminoimidazole (AIR) synthetase